MVPDRRQGGQHMAKEYVLAIDQGTTSTRAMLFRHNGTVAGVSQEEHEQIYPRAGWVEHDPKEIWDRTKQVTAAVLADANLTYENIAASKPPPSPAWTSPTPPRPSASPAGSAPCAAAAGEP